MHWQQHLPPHLHLHLHLLHVVLQHVKHDNGLTSDEKARLLNIFTKNPGAVETYLEVLDDDILRLGYAHELLKDN
jgi:hypothetical protein